jgi:predicted membrane protein (TIGR00267 family)
MRGTLHRLIEEFNYYSKISKVAEVARRYFVMNAFDGTLTMLGIMLGSYFVAGVQPKFVVGAGVGAIFAMAVSGFAGTFMTETAERKSKLKYMERKMLKKLKGTETEKAMSFASVYAAVVDGLSPALAGLVCVFPYILGLMGILSGDFIFYFSMAISAVVLFTLGVYLGGISKENAWLMGLKMILIGLFVGVLSFLLEFWI